MRDPSMQTKLAALLDQYLWHLRDYARASPHTCTAYRRDNLKLLAYLDSVGLPGTVESVTPPLVQRFANSLAGLAPATIRRAVYGVRSFFSFLQQTGVIAANPAARVALPRLRKPLPVAPTEDELERLFAVAFEPRERALLSLLSLAGLRRSEVIGLTRTSTGPACREVNVAGKGGKGRTLPLPPRAQQVLREYMATLPADQGPLFASRTGRPMHATTLVRIWQRLLRRAGLQDRPYSLHSLRRAYATMLLRSRTDIRTVADLLGHESIATTGAYLCPSGAAQRGAVAALPLGQVGSARGYAAPAGPASGAVRAGDRRPPPPRVSPLGVASCGGVHSFSETGV
jgi:site-specific recombinase XerD